MKTYINDVIRQLEQWSKCPNGPYEREEYKKGDYAVVGVGTFAPKENEKEVYVVGFHELLGLLLEESKADSIQNPSLLLVSNKIVEDRDTKGEVCSLPILIEKNKVITAHGPLFKLVPYLPLKCYQWKITVSNVPSTNLEHILSVMLYSPRFMEIFNFSIKGFLFLVLNDIDETGRIISQLNAIHKDVMVYRERSIH